MTKNKVLPVLLMIPVFAFGQSKNPSPPNVILVFVDDFGYGDLGCYGNTKHCTPNIDNMAKEGILLKDFYVASSVSTPSRAALLTGCYPKRISMHVNADPQPIMSTGRQVLFPTSFKGLNPYEVTIAELLKKQGYGTACIGKWHLGDQLAFLPDKHGFDCFYGIPYSHDMNRKECPLPLMEQDKVVVAPVKSDSLTARYTAKAVEYIRLNKKRPFFIYLCHNMTHNPLDASSNFKGKSQNGIYGDATEELDWSIGQILATLKEEKIDENTLVIFTSDNGAKEYFGGSNGDLRGEKGTVYEGGFRVPCIMRWNKKIPAGLVSNALVTTMDILPTLSSYCCYDLPKDRIIDGKDISYILEGKRKKADKELFFYYQKQQLQAVRWKNWKYHLPLEKRIKLPALDQIETSDAYLYDLSNDIAESVNIIKQHPEIVTQIKVFIEQIQSDIGDWQIEGANVRSAGYIDEPFSRTF